MNKLLVAIFGAAALLAPVDDARASGGQEQGTEPGKLSLPQGPASISGLGGNFAPSLASGTASYAVSIDVPPSAAGFGPKLSLEYDGGGGASELGLGWRIGGLPSVRRRTANGLPTFTSSDAFEVTGLGPTSELLQMPDDYYRAEVEGGAFVRGQKDGDGGWELRDKAGRIYRLGGAGFEEREGGRIATSLLREQRDAHGHRISYEWQGADGELLLKSVVWNDFGPAVRQELRFRYEPRPDAHELFSTGIRRVLRQRLTTIEVTLGGDLVRRYELAYGSEGQSQLEGVRVVGSDGHTTLPELTFRYTSLQLATDGSVVHMQAAPTRAPGTDAELCDLDGDTLPDLLVAEAGRYRSYLNHDGRSWRAALDWAAADSPPVSLSTVGSHLADLDGDGAVDLVVGGSTSSFRYLPGRDATHWGEAVAVTRSPSVSLEDAEVRLGDLDGDRRADAVMTTMGGLSVSYNLGGSDWGPRQALGALDADQDLYFSDGQTQLCEVNGDGVIDICHLRTGALAYWLGRGRGAFEARRKGLGVPSFEASAPWQLVDLDGDGWVDLVHVETQRVSYALAVAAGQWGPARVLPGTPAHGPATFIQFADMNGSGTVDIVWIDPSAAPDQAWQYLELFPGGRGGLLREIDNGLGKVVEIEYEPAASFAARSRDRDRPWQKRMAVGMSVVSRIRLDLGLGDPPEVTSFEYEGGVWDTSEHTFAGFEGGTQTLLGDEFTPSQITESGFDTGLERRSLRGAVLWSEQRDARGLVFSRLHNDYEQRELGRGLGGRGIVYGYLSSQRTEILEGKAASEVRTLRVDYEQDEFGNTIREKRWGETSGDDEKHGDDESVVTRSFANNAEDWRLGHLSQEELADAAGRRVSMKRHRYDGEPFVGLELGRVTRGDLTYQEVWVGPEDGSFVLDTATKYNGDGQPVETRHADGGGRIYVWDALDHTSLVSEQVKVEGAELIESVETDRRFGSPISVVEYNGSRTRFEYDALGRLTATWKPGDAPERPSTRYRYVLDAPLSRIVTDVAVWSDDSATEHREVLVDGLGRERGSLTRDGKSWLLAGVDLLDARGHKRRSLRPRFVSIDQVEHPPLLADAAGTSFWRDALGREIKTRTEGGIVTRTAHAPLQTLHWDGGQSDEHSAYEHTAAVRDFDGQGRVVSIGRTVEGQLVAARMRYDAAGNLTARIDPEGNVSRYEYEGRGYRTLVDDPDLGRRSMVYDAVGHLVERRSPDGRALRYTYDQAGRALTEDWDGDGRPEVESQWDHSEHAPDDSRFLGKLAFVRDPSGSTSHQYDERGRITNTTVTIDGRAYTSGSRFDNLDREFLHVYPDGSSIRIHRNARGQLSGYGNAVKISFDQDGVELERQFNTGVRQRYGYDTDRRVTELLAKDAGDGVIEHLRWSFDAAGNLSRVEDERPGISAREDRSEAYEYDNLYRLRSARGSWGTTTWSYSPSGNLLARRSTLAEQDARAVSYGEQAGPHAATRFDSRRLSYDASGRMIFDGQRRYSWNPADQLVTVSGPGGATSRSTYDSQGTRRSRVESLASGKTTAHDFISAWEEVQDGKLVRYIVHADRRIVRLAEDNGHATLLPLGERISWAWWGLGLGFLLGSVALCRAVGSARLRRPTLLFFALTLLVLTESGCTARERPSAGTVDGLGAADTLSFSDQLGSVLVETDGRGQPKAHFSAYPYGLTRSDSSGETRKYAGAERDPALELDHMGARFYAPDLGLWTAPDPILLTRPEALVTGEFGTANAYAYANLNPTIAVDEDGNFWHIVAGAGIGALMGGGMEAARQYYEHGKVDDWGRVGLAAAGGAVGGAITAAVPVIGILGPRGSAGAVNVLSRFADRAVRSGGKNLGTPQDVVVDFAWGFATAGTGRGGSPPAPKAKPVAVPREPNPGVAARPLSMTQLAANRETRQPGGGGAGARQSTPDTSRALAAGERADARAAPDVASLPKDSLALGK